MEHTSGLFFMLVLWSKMLCPHWPIFYLLITPILGSSLGRHLPGSFAGSPHPSVRLGMHIHGSISCCCHPYCVSISAPFDCEFLTGTLYLLHLLSLVAYCSLRRILGAHVTFSVWVNQGLPWYIPAVGSWASHLTSLSFSILICWKKWMYTDYKHQRW